MPYIIIGALIIGLLLGLMGAGGSILTVPVLVYLLGHDSKVAIAESLAIVGGIAIVTMFPYAHSRLVSWRNVVFFGVPGMAGTYLGAWLSHYFAGAVQLTLFAVMMLLAAVLMFRTKAARVVNLSPEEPDRGTKTKLVADQPGTSIWIVALEGVVVGIMTGLVGVGGGFLIVPALVVFGKLPMRVAVGTSLTVIAMNAFSGFYKYLHVLESLGRSIDWPTVIAFVLIGIVGSFVGHAVATRTNQIVLRKAFAVFLVGMGLFVLGKEGPKLLTVTPTNHVTRPAVLDRHAVVDTAHPAGAVKCGGAPQKICYLADDHFRRRGIRDRCKIIFAIAKPTIFRKQAPVVAKTLQAAMKGRSLPASYNGYTSCPLVTGYGKLVLAEFDYDKNPAETFPLDQSKERWSMYMLKKYGLPLLYWNGMLKGECNIVLIPIIEFNAASTLGVPK